MSMIFLTLTLYTMVKSIIPMIVMITSFIFQIIKPKLTLMISVILISLGILLSVFGTTEVSFIGVTLVLISCIIAGFRMVFLQKILQKEDESFHQLVTDQDFGIDGDDYKREDSHQISTILVFFYLSMLIGLTLLPFSIIIEWKKIYDLFSIFKLKDQTILFYILKYSSLLGYYLLSLLELSLLVF